MKKMSKFTDIGQFRHVVKSVQRSSAYVRQDENDNPVYDFDRPKPTLTFTGTVKSHGTNVGIGYNLKTKEKWYQSRRHLISPEKDNAGMAFFCESRSEIIDEMFQDIISANNLSENNNIFIYGEGCGGNIQKNVALTGLDKMLIIFAVKIEPHDEDLPSYYVNWDSSKYSNNNIYSSTQFGVYKIDIDFENPKLSQNKLADMTLEVEKECPIGKFFGRKLGEDNTVGEGIVWEYNDGKTRYIMKVKGRKHAGEGAKCKKLAPVDIEKLNTILEFVEYSVTEGRLNQGLEQVFTTNNEIPDIKKTGDYLRWVANDIIKEEADTMAKNNLEPKDVMRECSKKARIWFHKYLDEMVGL